MPDQEGGQVALFIDWDNLAISTAADHAGALPDLRRIVQLAQSYGTVLIARAYAEWGVTSERLAVFRAGVEPVYAPTFRFEAEQPGQPARGKSLADPCLVADCIDVLHLHPQLSTLVLVSGDKDLIPIVRLAQMRGKKVVVIGPDLVAAVLREMADVYVPYRSLVAGMAPSAVVRAEAAELGRRRRRRGRGGRGLAAAEGAPGPAEAAEEAGEQPAEEIPPPAPRHALRERRAFIDRAGIFRAEPTPAIEPQVEPPPLELPTPPEPVPAPAREELVPPPAPAEAPAAPAVEADLGELFGVIKSILQERTSAGRPRLRATNLKDHLLARTPGFSERRYGFSHFRDLLAAAQRAGALTITEVGQVQWISLPGVEGETPAPTARPAAQPPAEPAPVLDNEEAIAAIVEMRHHTRLLTPAYVTSTLGNLVNTRAPGRGVEEAQRTIDRLADQGVLRVDREPQEVEVNGAKHRVRLVHLVEDNPAVQRADAAWREKHQGADVGTETTPVAGEAAPEPAAASADGRTSRRSRRGRGGGGAKAEPAAGESAAAQPAVQPTPLDQVFDALVGAVRESIAPGKDTAGAAGVKSRLTRVIPTFNEHELGFSKFKDFLLAAEKAGRVRVETAGAATRVGLPGSPSS